MTADRTPTHWLRQRAGDPGVIRLNATEAEMIAQRPDAVGDYLSQAGLVWRERDLDVPGDWAYYTITPVFEEPRRSELPPVGSIARDTRTGHIGEVALPTMAGYIHILSKPLMVTLRTIGSGGLEWDVPIEHIEPIDADPEQQDATEAAR